MPPAAQESSERKAQQNQAHRAIPAHHMLADHKQVTGSPLGERCAPMMRRMLAAGKDHANMPDYSIGKQIKPHWNSARARPITVAAQDSAPTVTGRLAHHLLAAGKHRAIAV